MHSAATAFSRIASTVFAIAADCSASRENRIICREDVDSGLIALMTCEGSSESASMPAIPAGFESELRSQGYSKQQENAQGSLSDSQDGPTGKNMPGAPRINPRQAQQSNARDCRMVIDPLLDFIQEILHQSGSNI
jgi:hypothetical protein